MTFCEGEKCMQNKKTGIILVLLLSAMLCFGCGKADEEVPAIAAMAETEIIQNLESTEPTKTKEPQETETVEDKIVETEATPAVEETEIIDNTTSSEEYGVLSETAFTIEEMDAVIMYAKSTVNVRTGPSTEYEKVGGLTTGQEVTVTGIADTGWYRISYGESEGYVSNKYLTDAKQEAPVVTAPSVVAPTPEAPVASNNVVAETKTMFGQTYYHAQTTANGNPVYDTKKVGGWPQYLLDAIDAAGITTSMSDYDKCVAFNNYLCSTVSYGEINTDDFYKSQHSMYGALVSKTAMCLGYADAFQSLCVAVGIECDIVTGECYGYHAWNKVLVNGTWYYVDVTNNDAHNNAYLMSTSLWGEHTLAN